MASDPLTIYKYTTLGVTLEETLEKFVQGGMIPDSLRASFITTFQRTMHEELETVTRTATLRGKVHTYRNNQGVYTFYVQDAKIQTPLDHMNSAQMLKIVCVDDEQLKRKGLQDRKAIDDPHKKAKK